MIQSHETLSHNGVGMDSMRRPILRVHSSRIPAYLLARALRWHRIEPHDLTFQFPDGGASSEGSPLAIYLQGYAMKALQALGYELELVYQRGNRIRCIATMDWRNRLLFQQEQLIESDIVGSMVVTETFRQFLEASAGSLNESGPELLVRAEENDWTIRYLCPGIYDRAIAGSLRDPAQGLVFDYPHGIVMLVQVRDDFVICYSVRKTGLLRARKELPPPIDREAERRVCSQLVDQALADQRRHFLWCGHPIAEQWFPLRFIGYRSCWQNGTLRWGQSVLRLHPSAGQWVNYWAVQANRFARLLAEDGRLSPRCVQQLDQANRWMFWRHMVTLRYFFRPQLFWRLCFRPSAWLLRHSPSCRALIWRKLPLL